MLGDNSEVGIQMVEAWTKYWSPAARDSSAAISSGMRSRAHPDWHITTLDKLTYAGRLENLHDVIDDPRHTFVRATSATPRSAAPLVGRSNIVVHFAAETHVDRSIMAAGDFIRTDIEGTFVLLEAARRDAGIARFVQISTDEVYGSVPTGASPKPTN